MNRIISIFGACLLLMMFLAVTSVSAQSHGGPNQDASQPPCSDCHACQWPTKADPCLEMCLWTKATTTQSHTPSEGPSVSVMDDLMELYGPVNFNHKFHAEMVGMGEGCGICHHYSPEEKFPPCGECHGKSPSNPENLRQPSLKGAYHRQCMGCHREWSHDTKCVVCHLPFQDAQFASARIDTTDIFGISHPVITAPDTKVWTTPYKQGALVTFHHQEHIDLFGLRCVNCHKGENCGYCHDLQKEAQIRKTDEEIHAICNDCHLQDACSKCHDIKEKPVFTHEGNGGWALNRFHKGLNCRACHPTGRKIGKLSANCADCHGGWNQMNFRHAVTGLQLDELHGELDCGDCHMELQYDRIPKCSGCHDDCRNHEDGAPGQYVRQLTHR